MIVLDDLCLNIVDCLHKTAPINELGNYFAVGTPAMRGNSIDYSLARRIDDITFDEWTKRLRPRYGDLLLAREAPVGPVVRIPIEENVAPGQRTVLLRPDTAKVISDYLYYLLIAPEQQERLNQPVGGSTVAHLNVADVRSFRLPDVPSLMEQRRIAGVLGVLDDKIESNQAVVTGAEQLIDEIAEQKATDLPTVALSEVCSLSKSTWKPDTSSDQTVHLFSLPAFDEGAVPEQAAVSTIKSNKTLVDRPGILVSRLNPRISRMWWVETDATPVSVCSPEFAYLTAGDMHGLACTWLAVRSPEFRGEIVDRVTGTSGSHQRVRPADLMTIGVPDYRSLAEHIQATVLTLLHLVSDRRRQSVALAELRDVLLPELMSGRMRVDEAGCLVSEALDEEVRSV